MTNGEYRGATTIFALAVFAAPVFGCSPPRSTAGDGSATAQKADTEQLQAAVQTRIDPALMSNLSYPSTFELLKSNGVSIALPKSWSSLDSADANALNTNTEAMLAQAGNPVGQGNNSILFARNALNDNGTTDATARVSIRATPGLTQAQFRAMLAAEGSESVNAEMRAAGEQVVRMMLKLPMVREYKLVDAAVQNNAKLTCMWTRYEADYGGGFKVIDGWICPLGDRSLKLTTSYLKSKAILFEATKKSIWRSLSATT